MVCCGAKLILKELKEQNFELTSLPEHVVIQINDYPSIYDYPGTYPATYGARH